MILRCCADTWRILVIFVTGHPYLCITCGYPVRKFGNACVSVAPDRILGPWIHRTLMMTS